MRIKLEVEGKQVFDFDIPPEYFIDFLFTIPYFFLEFEDEEVHWITKRVGVIQKKIENVKYTYVVSRKEESEENEDRGINTNKNTPD